MPVSPEHLSALGAYERLWRSDATHADIEAAFAPGFTDHRPGAPGSGTAEFAGHRTAALDALSGLSARYEPIAGDGQRLAAQATVSGTHSGEFLGIAATGRTVSWREVHLFEVRDGRVAGHWMDAALLSAYLQMTRQGQPDAEAPRPVRSGLARTYTTAQQQAPLDAYMAMVAGHRASDARNLYTDDYLQHGPFGPNVTRDDFEAGNRDVVWKAMPDISIELTPFLGDGELVAYRGLGQGTHTGAELFGIPPAGKHVTFNRNPHRPDARQPGLRALAPGRPARPAQSAAVLAVSAPLKRRPAQQRPPSTRQGPSTPGGTTARPADRGRSAEPQDQAVSADSHPRAGGHVTEGAPAWRSTRSW